MSAFDSFIAAGVDLAFYGVNDEDGYLKGGTLTAPANGSTAGSPMLRMKGMVNADVAIAEPATVNVPGDNGTQGQFIFPPDTTPAFTLEASVFKLATQALAQGTLTYADGDTTLGVLQPNEYDPPDMCWILQSPSKKKDVGVNGVKAWSGYIIPTTQAYPIGRAAMRTREAATDRMRVTANPASMLPDGLAIDETNFGATGGVIVPFTNDYPIFMQRFTGDGTETDFTLTYAPAVNAASQIRVRVNGVLAVFGTDYTVNLSTKTITFQAGHIPTAGQKIIARIGFNP
ncbi:MAG: hypothetical protein IPK17_38500 [Chloroflexi bacterium]|uniref:hypothetical protein n=1 Tax=Candidatus Flexifilum breve TaxID=3140694 RepID=UPI003135C8A8|nr:hypothetical protein [Chloroflexota bacterium]